MTSTINISGGDLRQAHEALIGILDELDRRSASLIDAGQEAWPGPPDLYLVAEDLPQILADVRCRDLFRQVLVAGRKLGMSGVAYGNGETVASLGGCLVIRDLLTGGVPLAQMIAGNATSNATVTNR